MLATTSLHHRLAAALPELQLPARLVKDLAGRVAGEQVLLVAGDVRALGFGAYQGQVVLVTPTRVLLATGLRSTAAEGAFGVEEWERQTGPLPRFRPFAPRPAEPEGD